jgi:LAO/AO transport system kinase
MNNKIAAEIKKKVVNGRLSCPVAREIAEKFSIPYKEVGKTADELKIKISRCELGCF